MPKALLFWNTLTHDITLIRRDDAAQTVTTEVIGTAPALEESLDVAFTARPELTVDALIDPDLKEIPEDIRRHLKVNGLGDKLAAFTRKPLADKRHTD